MRRIILAAISYLFILITCSILKQEEYIAVLGDITIVDVDLTFFRLSSYTGFTIEALVSLIVLLIVGVLSFFVLIFLVPDLKITFISQIYSKSFVYILLAVSCSEILKTYFFIYNIDFVSFFNHKQIFNAKVLKLFCGFLYIDIIFISIGVLFFVITLFKVLRKEIKYYYLLPSVFIIIFYFAYIIYKNIDVIKCIN